MLKEVSEKVFNQDLIDLIRQYWIVLIIGPICVGLATFLYTTFGPGKFTSEALLRMDRATARTAEAIMLSPSVASRVVGDGDKNVEEIVKQLARNLRITDIEPSSDRSAVRLFRLEFSASDPVKAQKTSVALIDAWLATTIPGPSEKANIEAEIARQKAAGAEYTILLQKMQKEAVNLVMPGSMAGEIASPISSLIAKRDASLQAVSNLENRLNGIPRDIIVAGPHLPFERSNSQKGAAILATVLSFLVLTAAVVVRFRLVRA